MTDDAFMPETALRLFIGLQPDAAVQADLQKHQKLWRWSATARPFEVELFHMTLHCLGWVHSARLRELQQALATVPFEPFSLVLRTPALWEVAVLLADDNVALDDLRLRLLVPLMRMGLQVDGHWTPHVTLARKAKRSVPPVHCFPVHWAASHFSLVLSTPLSRPPYVRHEVLKRYPTQACTSISTRAPL